jgi:uncharacterized membrane protein YfcA
VSLHTLLVVLVGGITGLVGGAFGKGGSAIATPLLAAVGVPPFAALASPLPATIPATLVAAWAYARAGHVDLRILRITALIGVPATVAGALLSGLTGGGALIIVCDVVLLGLGLRILSSARVLVPVGGGPDADPEPAREPESRRVAATALAVGLASGLLANSGGFLLAPLFVTFLGLPLKRALGTSLATAAVLAVPGALVHIAMGHVAWSVAIPFGVASVPLSATGARIALRTDSHRLETIYGVGLVLLGGALAALWLVVLR